MAIFTHIGTTIILWCRYWCCQSCFTPSTALAELRILRRMDGLFWRQERTTLNGLVGAKEKIIQFPKTTNFVRQKMSQCSIFILIFSFSYWCAWLILINPPSSRIIYDCPRTRTQPFISSIATKVYSFNSNHMWLVSHEGKRNWSEDNTSEVSRIFNDFICRQVCPIGEMQTIAYSDIHLNVLETLVKHIASHRYSR